MVSIETERRTGRSPSGIPLRYGWWLERRGLCAREVSSKLLMRVIVDRVVVVEKCDNTREHQDVMLR